MATIKALENQSTSTKVDEKISKNVTHSVNLPLIVPEKKPTGVITLEDKIYKIQMLGDLIEQREKLTDSLKKLQSFKTVSDSFLDKIILKDGNGNEFATSNCDVLQKCLVVIKDAIISKLQTVEAQITF